jgi:antitoxin VapB
VFTRTGAGLITTEVEADRVRAEYGPERHGFAELAVVPWYEPQGFERSAQDLAGAGAGDLAADGHPAFGTDAADDLIALRLALSGPEQADLRDLGADAAAALEQALTAWTPGERDLDIQARCAAAIEAAGADAPVLIVGGDERVRRYRHPMAAGAPVRQLAMVVVVARRAGLHAAATRFASAGPVPPDYAALRARVLGIERDVLEASRPGRSYGDALTALDRGYAAAGVPGGWAGHYQGGPIGYAQREFEIAPGQAGSRWLSQPIGTGHAVAWNPSLPGGAKAEDTYLVTAGGLERVTASGGTVAATTGSATTGSATTGSATTGWPTEPADDLRPGRPAVLELAS